MYQGTQNTEKMRWAGDGLNKLFHTERRDSQALLFQFPNNSHVCTSRQENGRCLWKNLKSARAHTDIGNSLVNSSARPPQLQSRVTRLPTCTQPAQSTGHQAGPAPGQVSKRCHWILGTKTLQGARNGRIKNYLRIAVLDKWYNERTQILQIFEEK